MQHHTQKPYLWISIYILTVNTLAALIVYPLLRINELWNISILLLSLLLFIFAWKKSISNFTLYIHSIANFLLAATLAILVSPLLSNAVALISFLGTIAIIDLISFTRLGKHLPNRRIAEQTNLAKRLSVSLPLPGYNTLYQITGIGDLLVFALMSATGLRLTGINGFWFALVAIAIGQIFNIMAILALKNKPNYSGFPAAPIPITIFVILLLILIP